MGTWIGAVVQLIWDAGQPLAIGAAGRFRSGQLETVIDRSILAPGESWTPVVADVVAVEVCDDPTPYGESNLPASASCRLLRR